MISVALRTHFYKGSYSRLKLQIDVRGDNNTNFTYAEKMCIVSTYKRCHRTQRTFYWSTSMANYSLNMHLTNFWY